jgi:hypothetical protein
MKHKPRRRFWGEIGMLILSAALMIVTVVWPDWIEIVFGVDPDEGDGSLEWLIVAGSLVLAIVFLAASRREWRRTMNRGGELRRT